MTFVLDASVALNWVFDDEVDDFALAVREACNKGDAVIPWLWRIEVFNALVISERRGRIAAHKADEFAKVFRDWSVRIRTDFLPGAELIELCRKHQRTAYDAVYLALDEGCPLATTDGGLRQAMTEANVPLFNPDV